MSDDRTTTPVPNSSLRIAGVTFPAISMLMAAPMGLGAAGMLPDASAFLILAPIALGLAAAPGYLTAVLRWERLAALSPARRWWVRTSFLAGLAAGLLGAVIGLAFILPSIAAVLTVVNLVRIWVRLERRR